VKFEILKLPENDTTSVETCRTSVIICEIIVHLLVIIYIYILHYITNEVKRPHVHASTTLAAFLRDVLYKMIYC